MMSFGLCNAPATFERLMEQVWRGCTRKPVAKEIELLSEYDIQHRAGRKHQNADGLSQKPCSQCGKSDWKQLKIDAWKDLEVLWRTEAVQLDSSKTSVDPQQDAEVYQS